MRPTTGDADAVPDLSALDFYSTPSEAPASEESVAIDMAQLQQQPPSELQPLAHDMHLGTMQANSALAAAAASGSMSAGSISAAVGFGLPQNVATSMFSTMISGAREQAKARGVTGDVNSQIDFLRPYFDVETSEVQQRLLWAMHPRKGGRLLAESDLYAPTLLAFTLAALLHVNLMLSPPSSLHAGRPAAC